MYESYTCTCTHFAKIYLHVVYYYTKTTLQHTYIYIYISHMHTIMHIKN